MRGEDRLIVLQTLGTRGDVQPFLALARGLQAAGFAVRLATAPRFQAEVEQAGVAFAPLPGEMLALIDTPEGQAAISGRHRLWAALRLMRGRGPMFRRLLDAQWAAAQGAALLVWHPKALGGPHIAERLGIPGFVALPLPALAPTAAFPSPLLPFAELGPLNWASHALMLRAAERIARQPLRDWRQKVLGLPPAGRGAAAAGRLHAYSPVLVMRPADWDARTHVTGPWVLPTPQDWTPPPALAAFLAAGPPPVHVGFGSLPTEDAARMGRLVAEALALAGQRGVISTGWGGLALDSPRPGLHVIQGAPHGWLFPRMAAVVHHGGAGTTDAGLRAGCPTVVCPFFGDQPFWGRRVQALGVGPAPIHQRALTAEALAAAMRQAVSDPAMREAAGRLAAQMAGEDGVAEAIRILRRAIL
ncbi:glycosyltransferase [Falsiroseomonas sp.]|uniref:glycosyltransferase n=1 Tax=Falsiroseomonas sp. TaxID=2870721 RepID=UPI002735999F|nr:glycosyltransferase [Falsiroseomonas sp.]MDP3417455.1 glycosyltransferase [Falsiroseomonas sp.]